MQTQQPTMQDKQPSNQLIEAIRVLFQQWKAWFKNKMKTRDDDFDWSFEMVLVWARYLTKKEITQSEFAAASERSFDKDWMPNNAKEFLALARQEVSQNYPDMRAAYLSAANGNYSAHAVIFETAKRVGFWEMKSQSETVSYKLWQQHYPQVCREHADGAQFALPKSQRVGYEHTPMSADSPMAAKVDDFLNKFKRKHGSLA